MKKVILFVSEKKNRFVSFQNILKNHPDIEMIWLDTKHLDLLNAKTALQNVLTSHKPAIQLVLLENNLNDSYSGHGLVETIKNHRIPFASYTGYRDKHEEYRDRGAIGAVTKVPHEIPAAFEESFKQLLEIVQSLP